MRGKHATVAVLTVAVAACSTAATPATTPPSTPTTSTTVTTTMPPATSTTTTVATTTTLDRRAEIEAIFQDLEGRRLQALYEGDREAFRALFANDEYMERSMGAFDVVEFASRPARPSVEIVEIKFDSEECVAAIVLFGEVKELAGSTERVRTVVLEVTGADWGYSYSGEGWECDGSHPLSR